MIGEKVQRYQGKGTDLNHLADQIQQYLKGNGFKVQRSPDSGHGVVLQAKKGGFLAAVIAADRGLTVLVSGNPNDFTVRVGVGKWLKHLTVTAVEVLLLSELFILVDVPEIVWNLEIENKLAKAIDSMVG